MDKQLQKTLEKQYGKIFLDASFITESKREIIPVSPSIDLGLNGGIPEGSWMIISGPPKCGKTSTCLTIAANAQKQGRFVVYHDVECRLKPMNFKVAGLDLSPDKFKLVRSSEGNILHAGHHLNSACKVIENTPRAVIIIDSTSALCSEKEMSEEITGQTRALGPKMLAAFCRKMGGVVPVQKSVVIMMQHLIANTSGFGVPLVEDSGRKVVYQADVRMRCKKHAPWKDGSDIIGTIIDWDIVTSALGEPGAKPQSFFRFNHGLDAIWESLTIGTELGLITKAAAWYTLSYMGDDAPQFNGQHKLYSHFEDNPKEYKKLYKLIKEML